MLIRKRTHAFTDRHPISAAILYAFAAGFVMDAIAGNLNLLLHKSFPAYPQLHGPAGWLAAAPLILLFYHLYFHREFSGFFHGTLRKAALPALLFSGFWIVMTIIYLTMIPGSPHPAEETGFCLSFEAAIREEVCFRAVLLSTLLRKADSTKKIWFMILLSSALFGLVHAFNLLAGADPGQTMLQILVAFSLGSLLALLYLRSGFLLPAVAAHFIQNLLSFALNPGISSSAVMESSAALPEVLTAFAAAAAALLCFVLVKRDPEADLSADRKALWNGME